ncbi:MAG: GMC family oxidoreductase N-terminal domain-containing protein, partial [Bryobacteraceae bacterium]
MKTRTYDIVVIGSGAGGGTVAQELSPLCRRGLRIAVLEKGPKLRNEELGGDELKMCQALYEHGGAHLTAEKTMTLAYGGSTTVYTGTSLLPSDRVIRRWNLPDVNLADLSRRAQKFMVQNNVHFLEQDKLNDNNKLFVEGCKRANYNVEQFPLNVKGCRGSGLCNLGCPNQAKQGTGRVQLPEAERNGVEVVTRCEVLRIGDRTLFTRVNSKEEGELGEPSSWEPGEYRIEAKTIVVCGGAVGSPALLLRSGLGHHLPRIGHGFTCHPALIMVAAHDKAITNFVGHPKSFYVDEFAETERFVLETCMYFPFVTAKSLTGFGAEHSAFLEVFPRLQMILVLACDEADNRNKVTIDRQGKPVIHYRFTSEVRKGLVRGAIAAGKIFFAAGAQRVHLPVADPPVIESQDRWRLDRDASSFTFVPGKATVSAAHLQGGCAMGTGPEDSVTDSHGRVHGLPWLFVADASLFPNSLNINPYL